MKGFTLVEVLVVIVIIGILIALLLPAIHAVRDGKRQADQWEEISGVIERVDLFPEGTVALRFKDGRVISLITNGPTILQENTDTKIKYSRYGVIMEVIVMQAEKSSK